MIKRVLITSLIVFIIALIVFWLMTGGWAAVARTARTLMNPLDFFIGQNPSGSFIKLPWQFESPTRGPDISEYAAEADRYNEASGDEGNATSPDSVMQVGQVRASGYGSPYSGRVTISGDTAAESNPALEFIELTASDSNSASVPIAGWSLQSAVSGARAAVPQAAPLFVLRMVNNVQGISLEPGASVVLTTAASPVGTSFRENRCIGYLNELQTFTPELSGSCPTPSEALPMNADNLRTYGSSCFDYLNGLPQCHFTTRFPSDLAPACRAFIQNTMSYNGCVNANRNHSGFALPIWRAYLARGPELWSNTHDVIRLLDAEGRTVDVLTY